MRQRDDAIERARDAFARASVALVGLRDDECIAHALLEGAIGMIRLAAADQSGGARKLVERACREARK